jgi:hypothetical protein
MTWLLIVFGTALVLSPLMWLKQSPHQKRITHLRRQASLASLQVSLHRRPDAREDERRLEAVCYRFPWQDTDCRQDWVLQRVSNRGWPSEFQGWCWMKQDAGAQWHDVLAHTLANLPQGVGAIVASAQGIGVIWDERGDQSELNQICDCLHRLRQKAEEICL